MTLRGRPFARYELTLWHPADAEPRIAARRVVVKGPEGALVYGFDERVRVRPGKGVFDSAYDLGLKSVVVGVRAGRDGRIRSTTRF
jgi:hypothetical protein